MTRHVRLGRLADIAMAAVARLQRDDASDMSAPTSALPWAAALARARIEPEPEDRRLVALAARLGFSDIELLAAALLLAVETDPELCRTVALCQSPVGGSRPLVGLLATALSAPGAIAAGVLALATGPAAMSGCLVVGSEDAPLPERSVCVPSPVLFALLGVGNVPVGVRMLAAPEEDAAMFAAAASAWAMAAPAGFAVVGCPREDQPAFAVAVARAFGLHPALLTGDIQPAIGSWLLAAGAMPVLAQDLRPGEFRPPPAFCRDGLPWLWFKGRDGAIADHALAACFSFGLPDAPGRAAIWRMHGYGATDAAALSAGIRGGPGLIRRIATAARESGPSPGHALAAARDLPRPALDGLARRLPASGAAAGFVAPEALLAELRHLEAACRQRETVAHGLGPAASRCSLGVKALFHGPSGAGKSMAAEWLAARLGAPLYAVDLSSVTSKWIGETEKNLDQVLLAAEESGAMLLFDEADALFGARTEVGSSNDRFANSQTNYLLQRLERHDGVVLLTTNGRDRIDSAFTRRLDAIIAFPTPAPDVRLAIWLAHLGEVADVDPAVLDRLAAFVDLPGGHIRNIVLSAAVAAAAAGHAVDAAALLAATAQEYAKLGRGPPRELV